MEPSYAACHRRGELAVRAEKALGILESCTLCPRRCRVNRLAGETGFCRTGRLARVASYDAHFGEEAPLVGRFGSGTIFIASCNLLCTFCQNYDISHMGEGIEVEPEHLAAMMIRLRDEGCHNINFVTPTHVVPQILEALIPAVDHGLDVPLVYNCGGYEDPETLRLLAGVFDIYMPDFKFWDGAWAARYCGASDYRQRATEAIREMHRQAGDLEMDEQGIAVAGLLVRHLVMPNGVAGTGHIMKFLAEQISPRTYVNVMDQYRPCGSAPGDPHVNRRLEGREYTEAVEAARQAGLTRLDSRERSRVLFRFR